MKQENFASLFEQQISQIEMDELSIIDATIVGINNKFVDVDAGLKSISHIPISEFNYSDCSIKDYKVGDSIKVVIEIVEDGHGETRLSKEKAEKLMAWLELEEAFKNGTVMEGYTSTDRMKGGLCVYYKNIVKAFLPGSLIDTHIVKDFSLYQNCKIEFKVIKIDTRRNNVVVSRLAVLNDNPQLKQDLVEKMQPGNIVKGIVKNIIDYGAFVDLGGIDGLLYITDMSWSRIKHPSDIVTLGQEIEAVVLNFDQEKHRVSLGLKQLTTDPWNNIQLAVGDITEGKVSNITDYGLFAEISPGVEGLIHVSEISWTNKNVNPNKLASVGDTVQVKILEIDLGRKRIALGVKQCLENPWHLYNTNHQIGDIITGAVRSITDFGIFVGLEQGIDGLVHISDLAWGLGVGAQEIDKYKKNQEVVAKILDINVEKERIALTIKQLDQDNPYCQLFNTSKVGDVLTNATVIEIHKNEAILQLESRVCLILPAKEVAEVSLLGDDLKDIFKIGDLISKLEIINLDMKNSKIIVTNKLKANNEETSTITDEIAEVTDIAEAKVDQ